jgi:uncharacterized protein (TIGR02271 family)
VTGAHRGDLPHDGDRDETITGDGAETIRHEERLDVGTEMEETGRVHVRKHVESHPVEYSVPRDVEHVDTNERIAAEEGDSGEVEVLDDGSVSIPVFEEVLVVTKRLVVRERVIVRKRTVVDEYKLQTELRREQVTVDADGVDLPEDGSWSSGRDRTGELGSTDESTDQTDPRT